jgi:hypothetical protein
MKAFMIFLVGTPVAALGALWFGETLARYYPDGGLWVFLSYYAVHVASLVIVWTLAVLSIHDKQSSPSQF